MDKFIKYELAKEYTETPGGRKIKDGEYSGEDFRDNVLKCLVNQAIKSNKCLLIDLDGVYGYATSFLDEAFGILADIYKDKDLTKIIKFKSEERPALPEQIYSYMKEHRNENR